MHRLRSYAVPGNPRQRAPAQPALANPGDQIKTEKTMKVRWRINQALISLKKLTVRAAIGDADMGQQ
jgi:hypothetical protein